MGGVCSKMGILPGVSDETSIIDSTKLQLREKKPRKEQSDLARDTEASCKGRDRRSCESSLTGVLQPSVCCPKEGRVLETDYRPVHLESIPCSENLQDGHSQVHLCTSAQRRLDLLHRPYGRLLSHTYPQELKKVPKTPVRVSRFSVQGSSFRNFHRSLAVHKGTSVGQVRHRPSLTSLVPVHRRLVGRMSQGGNVSTAVKAPACSLSKVRLKSKLSEVGASSKAAVLLHRDHFRSIARSSVPYQRKHGKGVQSGQGLPPFEDAVCQAVAVSSRSSRFSGTVGSLGQIQAAPVTASLFESMEAFHRPADRSGVCSVGTQTSLAMVAGQGPSHGRSTLGVSPVHVQVLHGRVQDGLGGPCSGEDHSGCLVAGRVSPAYQHSRDEGCQTSSLSFQSSSRLQDFGSHRQLDSCMLHQPRRRDQVSFSLGGDCSSNRACYSEELVSARKTHPREAECDCRPAQSCRSNSTNRVVPPFTDGSVVVSRDPSSSSGSFRHEIQPQTSCVCLSSSRSDGSGHRCVVNELGGSGCVRISSAPDSLQGPGEVSSHESVSDSTGGPIVAQPGLVSRANQVSQCSATTDSCVKASSQTTSVRHVSPRSTDVESARLGASKAALEAQGFSKSVRDRVVAPQSVSTRLLYSGRWKLFCKWCQRNDIVPHSVTVPQVAEFLLWLFDDFDFSPKTIEGYRSAIASSLKFSMEADIGRDQRLSSLIHSFYRERPKSVSSQPPWDLSIVLNALGAPPFEPIDNPDKVSLQLLTWKTVFLVLLASGCRRGEIHALRHDHVHRDEKWKYVTLVPDSSFISKTQLRTSGATALKPITIKALSTLLPSDQVRDRAVCPVRALKTYLARTCDRRKGKKLLFISQLEGHSKDIHPNTISGWVRKLIIHCYRFADDQTASLSGTSTHAIRGLAASLAFRGTASLEDVLSACSWKSHNTFTSHYLKDVSGIMGGLHRLGPLVAAQSVVHPQ